MGTRSLIRFLRRYGDGRIETFARVFQMYDGYIACVGLELARWLAGFKTFDSMDLPVTDEEMKDNGYYFLPRAERYPMGICSNGIEDLAAQYIAKFKTQAGNLYLHEDDALNEEYTYNVIWDESKKKLVVGTEFRDDTTDDLSVTDFLAFCEEVRELDKNKEPIQNCRFVKKNASSVSEPPCKKLRSGKKIYALH